MELKRFSLCMAVVLLAFVSTCSEARHSMHRRDANDEVNYDDALLGDAASDDEAQNDADGGDDQTDEDEVINAVILSKPEHYNLTLGRTVRLPCKVSPQNGVVVQWSKHDLVFFIGKQKASPDERFSLVPNTTDLLIKDVRNSDSGTYNCQILQDNPVTVSHTLSVTESPRIVKFTATDNGRLIEGSDLLLTCEATGSPPPQVVWSREGNIGNERLQEKDGEFSMNSVLIKNVRREHSGKYYCYALNGVGHNQAELTVTVFGKPRVHVHKAIVNSAINMEAILQCSAHEEPPLHIRWYKDGLLIEDTSSRFTVSTLGSRSNLTVVPATDQDFGTFTCEAENPYGKHNRSIALVQSPVVDNLDVEGTKLSWTVHSHQQLRKIELQLRDLNGNGNWSILDIPIPESRSHEYEVTYVLDDKDLQPGKYEALVRVQNENSWSRHVDPVYVDIEAQPQYIQHASVFRENGAYSLRPTATVLSTVLMYLLVRML